MKATTLFSANITKGGSDKLSGYYKLDLPTGGIAKCTGKTQICRCGKSQNKPFCDESHVKCIDGMVNPWF